MKKLILLLAILGLGAGCSALAQTPGQPTPGPGNTAGILYASSFGQWTIAQGSTPANGGVNWPNPSSCRPTAAYGMPLMPFIVGSPIKIIDAQPAHTENVTVTSFNAYANGCSFQATMNYIHNSYFVTTATGGLQEAINYAAGLPYQVVLTSDWTRLGGTTAMITAVAGNSNVSILDERANQFTTYTWNGSAYVISPFITTGCLGGNTVANGCTGATLPAGANLAITGVTQTGALGTSSQVSAFPGTIAAAASILGPSSLNLGGIVARGDSFTAGTEGNTDIGSYPQAIKLLSSPNIVNQGVGGATSTQVCVLFGVCPTTVTMTGNAIAACSSLPCSGTVGTFATGHAPLIYGNFTAVPAVYGTIQSSPAIPVMVTVASGGVYTFTPTDITAGATVSPATTLTINNPYPGYGNIFWSGRNDMYTGGPTQLETNTATMVAAVPAGQSYLVLSIPLYNIACGTAGAGTGCTGTSTGAEWPGTSDATLINSTNAVLAAAYPNNYLDINPPLLAAYNHNLPTDVSDVANGVAPTSLRAVDGAGTLTSTITAGTTGSVTTCNITLTLSILALPSGDIATIDDGTVNAENVAVVTAQNTTPPYEILTCVRGYGGVNGSHNAGATVTITEPTHLRREGYAVIAQAVAAKLQSLTSQGVSQASLNAALGPAFVSEGFYSFDTWNTAAGVQALAADTTGSRNTATGYQALSSNTTGLGNDAHGGLALQSNTTGTGNDAFGFDSQSLNSTGNYNTSCGYFSLFYNLNSYNTACGFKASFYSTVGPITALGYQAAYGASGMTATNIVAVGENAAGALTSAVEDVAVGDHSLSATTTASQSTGVGYFALGSDSTTSGLSAFGYFALEADSSGVQNAAFGYEAGQADTSGGNNSFFGYSAGTAVISGGTNSCFGSQCLYTLTTGSGNTAIGAQSVLLLGASFPTIANDSFLGYNSTPIKDGISNCTALGMGSFCLLNNSFVAGNSSVTSFTTGAGQPLQLSIQPGAPTYTAGTNVTSCTQASGYTNSNQRGELTIVGGTATTGTICTLNFSQPLYTVVPTSGHLGATYAVGDTVTWTCSTTNAVSTVTVVSSGAVTKMVVTTPGAGCAAASGATPASTSGSGTGLEGNFVVMPPPNFCQVDQVGGVAFYGIGHGTPGTTMTISSGATVVGATVTVDYTCQL
jgi:hypothetical protein